MGDPRVTELLRLMTADELTIDEIVEAYEVTQRTVWRWFVEVDRMLAKDRRRRVKYRNRKGQYVHRVMRVY